MTSDARNTPPHDLEAERATIGALLLGGSIGGTPLAAADFMRTAHGLTFDAIASLRASGEAVDAVTVAARLEAAGRLEDAGGRGYLLECADAAPVASRAPEYAAIVRDRSRRRALIREAREAEAQGHDAPDADTAIGRAITALLALADTGHRPSARLSDAVSRRLEEYASPTPAAMLPGSGVRLHFGDLAIIGGRPGTGKTALAIQAADVWRKRWPVLFLSFEMSVAELADRFIARAIRVSSELAFGGLSDRDLEIYRQACADLLADDSLELVQAAGQSEAQTFAAIRAFAAKGGRAVIVDYAQIACERRGDENSDLTRFIRGLQQTAKQTGVLTIALSQYARAAADARPALHHLRGSGALEQEGACVGLLWTPEPDDAVARKQEIRDRGYLLDVWDERPLVRLDWRKVRHGKTCAEYYLLDGASMHLEPIDRGTR